jgi:hypothetical protein
VTVLQRCRYEPADPDEAVRTLGDALQQAGLRPGLARVWLMSAAAHVDTAADLVLEYDEDLRLVSLEAFVQDVRTFGIDDLV